MKLTKFFLLITIIFISDLAFANGRGELKQMDRGNIAGITSKSRTESLEFDTFYKTYKELKATEKWDDIVKLCNKTLAVRLPPKEEAILNVILVSNLFYLGRHDEALYAADRAVILAESAFEDLELYAKGLYLKSAASRALALKSSNESSKRSYQEISLSCIGKALRMRDSFFPLTAGKILFNAGALHQDVIKDQNKAANYYEEAIKKFEIAESEDDLHRVSIRYARLLLEENKPRTALEKIRDIKVNLDTKTGIQLCLCKSKIYSALGDHARALGLAMKVKEAALAKNMVFEAKESTKIIEGIKAIDPSISPVPEKLVAAASIER